MFRPVSLLILLAFCLLCACSSPRAASSLEVRTTGDARVYGVYTSNPYGGRR
jgi:hypothetical protein